MIFKAVQFFTDFLIAIMAWAYYLSSDLRFTEALSSAEVRHPWILGVVVLPNLLLFIIRLVTLAKEDG